MGKVYRKLMADHANLTRVLQVLSTEISRLGGDDKDREPDFMLIEDVLDYIRYYPEAVHHPLEEAAFEHLVKHSLCQRDDVIGISTDHRRLEEKTASLKQKINSIEAGHPVSFEALRTELDDYLAAQAQHMQLEEERIFPLIEALGDSEDAAIFDGVHHRNDPLIEAHRRQQFARLLSAL